MNTRAVTLAGLALAATAWVALSAQQEMLPRPGPGSGVTPVRVVEEPVVRLAKGSEVRVADPVTVTMRPPSFVVKGRTLEITWSTGDDERVTVGDVLDGGWIDVGSAGGGTRYINLTSARSVRTVR
jgi:hypothetical protein